MSENSYAICCQFALRLISNIIKSEGLYLTDELTECIISTTEEFMLPFVTVPEGKEKGEE